MTIFGFESETLSLYVDTTMEGDSDDSPAVQDVLLKRTFACRRVEFEIMAVVNYGEETDSILESEYAEAFFNELVEYLTSNHLTIHHVHSVFIPWPSMILIKVGESICPS